MILHEILQCIIIAEFSLMSTKKFDHDKNKKSIFFQF